MSLERRLPEDKRSSDYSEEQKRHEEYHKKEDTEIMPKLGMSYDGDVGMKLPNTPFVITKDGLEIGFKLF